MSEDYVHREPSSVPMWEACQQLPPKLRQLYECRMSVTPPRTARDCAILLEKNIQTIHNQWKLIRGMLGYDPLAEAKKLGQVHRGGSSAAGGEEKLVAVNPEVLARHLEMRALAMLKGITAEKIQNTGVGELSRGVKEMISMRQLLRGEPTQILSTNQRAKLFEIMPAIVKELARRGNHIEIGPSGEMRMTKQVRTLDAEPVEEPHEAAAS